MLARNGFIVPPYRGPEVRDALKQDPSKIVGAIEEALRLRLPFFGDGAAREIYAGFARARGPAARGGRPG